MSCQPSLQHLQRRRVVARTVACVAAVAVMATACHRAATSAPPSVNRGFRVASPPTAAPPTSRPPTAVAGYEGSLPQPLTYYETHAAEFFQLVRSKSWLGWARPRLCEGPAACQGANPMTTTWASMEAISDANTIDIPSIQGNGVIFGRLRNLGIHQEKRWHIPPGNSEWYLVALATNGKSAAHQQIAVLTFTGNGTPKVRVRDVEDGALMACSPAHPTLAYGVGDFVECDDAHRASGKLAAASYLTAPAWISCAHGCCTSEFPLLDRLFPELFVADTTK